MKARLSSLRSEYRVPSRHIHVIIEQPRTDAVTQRLAALSFPRIHPLPVRLHPPLTRHPPTPPPSPSPLLLPTHPKTHPAKKTPDTPLPYPSPACSHRPQARDLTAAGYPMLGPPPPPRQLTRSARVARLDASADRSPQPLPQRPHCCRRSPQTGHYSPRCRPCPPTPPQDNRWTALRQTAAAPPP